MTARQKPSQTPRSNATGGGRTTIGYTFGLRRDQLDLADLRSHYLGNFSRYCQLLLEFDEANPKRLPDWVKAKFGADGWNDGSESSYHRHSSIKPASKDFFQARAKSFGITAMVYFRRLVDMDAEKEIVSEHLDKTVKPKL